MKVLSLRQPWLWAVLELGKTIENRRWNTHYRGPILLHAAKGCTESEYVEALNWTVDNAVPGTLGFAPALEQMERGGICGYAEIVDVVPPTTKQWPLSIKATTAELRWHMPEQFGFVLRNVRRLPFVPHPGSLGLFNVPDDVAAKALGVTP